MATERDHRAVQLPAVRNEDGQILLRVALVLTVYFENGFTRPVRAQLSECLERFRSLAGDRLRWMVNPGNQKWQRIDEVGLRTLRDSLRHEKWEYDWATCLQGGRNPQEASEWRFKAFMEDGPLPALSHVQATIPIEGLESPSVFLREVSLPLCASLRPHSGYGGYAFVSSPNRALEDEAQPSMFALAQRFPGVEVATTSPMHVAKGIRSVNWLTVLGAHWIEVIGGAAKLREQLPRAAKVHDYPGGLIIQAGEAPVAGDVNHRVWPTAYAEVAKVLRPIRLREHGSFHNYGPGRFTRESSDRWLARFDEPPPFTPISPAEGDEGDVKEG